MNTPVRGTLLVIDDMPNNVKILLRFLGQEGFKVLAAQNGRQGIKTAEYACPDLILLDVMMPEMDGFETCHHLKTSEVTKNIPVIFMTALADTVDKVKGFSLGAADYITKPLQHEEVLARVNAHLTLRRQQLLLQEQTELLQTHMAELEKRNLELDAFAHTVAHDLKSPLNAVIGLSDLLLTECTSIENPKIMRRLQMVNRAGYQMLNIINALLLLAGVSQRTQVTVQPLDTARIIDQVIQNRITQLFEEYQVEIELPPSWPMAIGYAPWIEEVWFNYLSNGCKYGGCPVRLKLGASTENEMIRFWIQDNGSGLSPESQAQLFTPFTRLHQQRGEGHGLGLSIVKQIIEKLGGQVGVESTVGQGSLFYFTLSAYRE